MCGICAILQGLSNTTVCEISNFLTAEAAQSPLDDDDDWGQPDKEACLKLIQQRGPSYPNGFVMHKIFEKLNLELYGSVLHLRGSEMCQQPFSWPPENPQIWVLWNGEIFGGALYEKISSNESDTRILTVELFNCFQDFKSGKIARLEDFQTQCLNILDSIHGPFSFIIYFGFPLQQLWIGRDKIGRRSLCFYATPSSLVFASVVVKKEGCHGSAGVFPTGGILVLSFSKKNTQIPCCEFLPWIHPPPYNDLDFLREPLSSSPSRSLEEIVNELECVLKEALLKRITVSSSAYFPIGILFSGGLDSGLLAYLCLEIMDNSCGLELVNVAFGDRCIEVPDRVTALTTYKEIKRLSRNTRTKLICCNISHAELLSHEARILEVVSPKNTHMDFNIGAPLYFASRGVGAFLLEPLNDGDNSIWWNSLQQDVRKNYCLTGHTPHLSTSSHDVTAPKCCQCNVKQSKLFCSNLYCRTCCKRLIKENELFFCNDDHFEKGDTRLLRCKVHRHSASLTNVPCTEKELVQVCLYDLTVPSTEYMNCDVCKISHSVPLSKLTSPVLIVGHGADELFGGYSRHRTAYLQGGPERFRGELIKDMERLWIRNLGRDDRCLSCWGREVRHPFLDEQVLSFVSQLPIQFLMFEGEDKFLLRHLARRFGLELCSRLKKRAIQFGSRSSRQTNLLHFSSHRKACGNAIYFPSK